MTQTNEETCEELIEVDTKLYLKDDILELKKVDEYIEYEKKTLGLNAFSKPGKTPIRLNKRETKVSSVYYFIVLFMAKWSGEVLKKIIENIFRENFTAHGSKDLQDKISELEADVTARDLKLDQRTQEADVTAKERIILEKTEENNRIRGKFKAQGSNGKSVANTVMEVITRLQQKKRSNRNRKRENALRNATGGSWRCEDYGIGLQVKEQDDFIN
ncbi:15629_t:CDS:2 [Rhizophagus irregularis]|nr:15629_t:CDS:2 [Rhizophagus irregularis]